MPPLARLRRYLPLAFLVAILAAFYFAVGRFLDGARTLESLERLDPTWAAAALGCAALVFLLKALRWHCYLASVGYPLPGAASLVLYLAGQWFAVARGADLSRVVLATRFGVPFGMAMAVGAAASLADFAGVVAVGLVPALAQREFLLALLVAAAASVALIWSLGGDGPLGRMVERELPAQHGEAVRRGRRLLRGRPLGYGLAISLLDSLAAAGVMWCSARALGLEVTPLLAALVFSLAQIAGVLSLVPLGLGVVETSGILLLVAAGVDRDLATATLVLYRLATLGVNMLLGGASLPVVRLLRVPARAAPVAALGGIVEASATAQRQVGRDPDGVSSVP